MNEQRSKHVSELLNAAVQVHQSGDVDAAEARYREVLRVEPGHPDALHLLGVIALGRGQPEAAAGFIAQAIERHPAAPLYHINLGSALQGLGRLEEAAAALREALRLDAGSVEALTNLGNVLQALERNEEAAACYRRALALRPGHLNALRGLAHACWVAGERDESIEVLRRLVQIAPHDPSVLQRLGEALRVLGRGREAIPCYGRLSELCPQQAEFRFVLGGLLSDAGQHAAAVQCLRGALESDPSHIPGYHRLGLALFALGQYGEASDAFRSAVGLNADAPAAHNNLAMSLSREGDCRGALESFHRAIALDPGYDVAYSNYLLQLNYSEDDDPETVYREHCRWAQRFSAAGAARPPVGGDRPVLRVGYLSPDFRQHSVSHFIGPILRAHDRSAFRIFCYSNTVDPDGVTDRLRRLSDEWRDIREMSDEEVCEQVRRDGIDILVDLAGHMAGHRLPVFARRPAPVQVTYLGYPNTTGLAAIDYRLSDAVADPPGADAWCAETLVRLPGGFLCYEPGADAQRAAAPPCVDRGHVTFGSFNIVGKISRATLDLWAAVLHAVPGSRLLLKTEGLRDPAARRRLESALVERGLGSDRLTLLPPDPTLVGHLQRYGEVDIALDTFPYNGTTTTCEALWMGVPVVTLCGDRHAARVGASLLTCIGAPELIAADSRAYVTIASSLAADRTRLARYRSGLRERMGASPLMNPSVFVGSLEQSYRQMWQARARCPS